MPQMSEEEFNEGMRNFEKDGGEKEGDVMFMSMDIKNNLKWWACRAVSSELDTFSYYDKLFA